MDRTTLKNRMWNWLLIALVVFIYVRLPWTATMKVSVVALALTLLLIVNLVYSKLIRIQHEESVILKTSEVPTTSFSAIVRGKVVTAYVGVGWIELWSGSPFNPTLEFATSGLSGIRLGAEYRQYMSILNMPVIKIFDSANSEQDFLRLTPLAHKSQLLVPCDKDATNAIVKKFYLPPVSD